MSFILTSDTLNLLKVDYNEGRVESFKVSWNNNRTAKQGALKDGSEWQFWLQALWEGWLGRMLPAAPERLQRCGGRGCHRGHWFGLWASFSFPLCSCVHRCLRRYTCASELEREHALSCWLHCLTLLLALNQGYESWGSCHSVTHCCLEQCLAVWERRPCFILISTNRS